MRVDTGEKPNGASLGAPLSVPRCLTSAALRTASGATEVIVNMAPASTSSSHAGSLYGLETLAGGLTSAGKLLLPCLRSINFGNAFLSMAEAKFDGGEDLDAMNS